MNKNILNAIKFLVFLGLSLLIFWYVFKNQDIDSLKHEISKTNFSWIWFSLFLGLLSHISRAMRWNILIEPLGYKPKLLNTFSAVMVMYLANYALPRFGEVARAGVMKKYEKISFSELFGTVIIERAVDFLLLFICFIIVLFTQSGVLMQFVENNPGALANVYKIMDNKWIIALFGIGFLLFMYFLYRLRHKVAHFTIYIKMRELLLSFWAGMKTITQLKRKWEFIFHSVFIYVMYFLMLYVCFFAFNDTSHFGLLTGLTVFVMAGLGMVVPVQGGIGAWHWLVTRTLFVYGITIEPVGNAFALVVHTSNSLLLIVLGFMALVFLPIYNKKQSV
jgi:uncharacterized protein (TIRG00374 family)